MGAHAAQRLAAALAAQAEQVARRVSGGGNLYATDIVAFDRASAMIDMLRRQLNLGAFLETLNVSSGKAQLLLAFESDRGDVVIKIYGKVRPNEAAVQAFWAQGGISVVPVLARGDEPVSWLLMPFVVSTCPDAADLIALTREVAQVMRPAHGMYQPSLGSPNSLRSGVGEHLATVLSVAERHGYQLPLECRSRALQLYDSGIPCLLHGDLVPRNLLRAPSGQLLMIDTCGYTGPPEFDAARWCARMGGPEASVDLLRIWMGSEPDLDVDLAYALLGVELLMQAGVYEIVKDESGQNANVRDPRTESALELGAELAMG